MSVCSQVNIYCDSCGEESSTWQTIGAARTSAKLDGWKRRKINGVWKDFCDQCQDFLNNNECDDALQATTGEQS